MSKCLEIEEFYRGYKKACLITLGFLMLLFIPGTSHAACGFNAIGDYLCDGTVSAPVSAGGMTASGLGPAYIPQTPAVLLTEETCNTKDDIMFVVNNFSTSSTQDTATNQANVFISNNGSDCASMDELVEDLMKFESFMAAIVSTPCGSRTVEGVSISSVPKPVFSAYLQEKIAYDAAWADNLEISQFTSTKGYLCREISAKQQKEIAEAKLAETTAAFSASAKAEAAAESAKAAAAALAEAAKAAEIKGAGAGEAAAAYAAATALSNAAESVFTTLNADPPQSVSLFQLTNMAAKAADAKAAADAITAAATAEGKAEFADSAGYASDAAVAAKAAAEATMP